MVPQPLILKALVAHTVALQLYFQTVLEPEITVHYCTEFECLRALVALA